ncbi:DUF1353 domain-containing protein [Geodermatophilus chilensis]|uniref:DUF1353 domain-containing protein n=1 Tax=Geodermatophilus chilensis TaxID=2035835 RepID=UPI0012FFDB94|nr:DUF1353 domain-containing protein [Geodermatophilus chilensis]
MPFADRVRLRYVGRGWYESTAPTNYVWRDGVIDRVITIPAGTRSDLASTPRIMWWFIPPTGAYEDAAFVHDEGCVELRRAYDEGRAPQMTSREVDALFLDVLREADRHACETEDPEGRIPGWKRRLLWVGVRWGALANPARRAGWWRDAPAVLAITAPLLALVVGALLAVHALVDAALGALM